MTPAFHPESTLDPRDGWALINARRLDDLAERFGSLRAAERAWRRHREAVIGDRRNGPDPPQAWWLWDSGRTDLFAQPTTDPRLPEYAAEWAAWQAERAAVLVAHADSWRWPRVERQFNPTRRAKEKRDVD